MKNSLIIRAVLKVYKLLIDCYKASFTCKVMNKSLNRLDEYFKNSLIYRGLIGNKDQEPRVKRSILLTATERILQRILGFFHNLYIKGSKGSLIFKGINKVVSSNIKNNKLMGSIKITFNNSILKKMLVMIFVFEPEE